MTDMNKEAISVLNDLIETSKDGQAGFKTCLLYTSDAADE